MGKPTLTGRKYQQGYFHPKNTEKYLGDPNNIMFRSGWERLFMQWCDKTASVVKWTSETTVIPYISPLDGKEHRYFIDFSIVVQQEDGTLRKFLVEIKPKSQTKPPRAGKNKSETRLQEETKTYYVNQSKWASAQKYAETIGARFIVLTEDTLLVKTPYRRKHHARNH